MSKSKEELIEEKIKCEKELEILEHQNQRLENRIEYLTKGDRAKRTHRLCEKGGAIESVCPETKDRIFRIAKEYGCFVSYDGCRVVI